MILRNIAGAAVAMIIFSLCGCGGARINVAGGAINKKSLTRPLLLVVTDCAKVAGGRDVDIFGRALLAGLPGNDKVFAGDVIALKAPCAAANILRDGKLDVAELRLIGCTAGVKEIMVCDIQKLDFGEKRQIAVKGWLLQVDSKQPPVTIDYSLNLDGWGIAAEFDRFRATLPAPVPEKESFIRFAAVKYASALIK